MSDCCSSPEKEMFMKYGFLINYSEPLIEICKKQIEKIKEEKVALLLSGGIDSSGLAILLKQFYKGKVVCYVASFPGNENQVEQAIEIAKRLNYEYKVIKVEESEECWKDVMRAIREPIEDGASIPLLFLARKIAEDGFNMALSGDGNDESLAGYDFYFKPTRRMWFNFFTRLNNFSFKRQREEIYNFDINVRLGEEWIKQRSRIFSYCGVNLFCPFCSEEFVNFGRNIPLEIKTMKDNKWIFKEAVAQFDDIILKKKKITMGFPKSRSKMKHREYLWDIYQRSKK